MRPALALLLLLLACLLQQRASAALLPLPRLFRNNGTVQAGDAFGYYTIPCEYLEPDMVTQAPWAWADGGACPYLYQLPANSSDATPPRPAWDFSIREPETQCTPGNISYGYDRPAGDLVSIPLPPQNASAQACQQLCCQNNACVAFVYAIAPTNFNGCKQGDHCCYLKNEATNPVPSTIPQIANGLVKRPSPLAPPAGMRSAVPQGGIFAGSVELRADGGLYQWTIVNQSPAGAAKFPVLTDAFFAIKASSGSSGVAPFLRTIRTHPPPGLPGVQQLLYEGAYPVGRLTVQDPALPAGITVALYAYSSYKYNDLLSSSYPAILYTLEVNNTGSAPAALEFMFNLPLALEENMARAAGAGSTHSVPAASAADCWRQCSSNSPGCTSFNYDASNQTCNLSTQSPTPLNVYVNGSMAGIPGQWSTGNGCLTLNRPTGQGAQGNASLCFDGSSGITGRFFTADNASAAFAAFADGTNGAGMSGAYGAVSLSANAPAQSTQQLTIALSWFFPHRDHLGTDVGNYYGYREWQSSADVGQAALQAAPSILTNITALHHAFFTSSLPEWLQDVTVNSLSHIRSAWWTRDGRTRQWEAYDCVNVDSVHNDGERHIPYITIFPDITRNKMLAWAKFQLPNGMIQEQLGCGCTGAVPTFDNGCGRVMSDVTSMFMMYTLELYKWANDTAFLQQMWPYVAKGAQWQMSVSQQYGLPAHLVSTYDILGLDKYPVATYNSIFHLMAMRVCVELSTVMGNQTLANQCQAALTRGQQALDNMLWVEQTGNVSSYYAAVYGVNASLMADSFYGQVLAFSAGLGVLSNATRMASHLQAEYERNDTPFGLRVMTGPTIGDTNTDVWQGGSPNWATLNMHLGAMSVDQALTQPEKSLNNWRLVARDQWEVAGISTSDTGLPYVTSHYGFHMVLWHITLALSGQDANLPAGSLSFEPKLSPPYNLPVLLPGVLGSLSAVPQDHAVCYTLSLAFGQLTLQHLAVGSDVCPDNPVVIKPGTPVTWLS